MGKKPINAMLRKEHAQDETWNRDFLLKAEIGYVATQWEMQPFMTPVLFVYDASANEIYFHTNVVGRLRQNIERFPKACFSASRWGRLLPSNAALEFALQYESVVAFGEVFVIKQEDLQRKALYALIEKYFPDLVAGEHYRPITESELKRTAVYAFKIESWSGKRNWPEQAEQIGDWPPIPLELLKKT